MIYHKVLPLNIPSFIKNCYLRMSVPVLTTIAAGIGINYLIPDGGWMILVVKAGIVTLIYMLSVLLFGLSGNERKSLLGRLKR